MKVVTKVEQCAAWLEDLLRQRGPLLSVYVKQQAASKGWNDALVKRAATRLNVISANASEEGKPRVTVWDLP